MLNVLSFFFISFYTLFKNNPWKRFRCSTFWAFSLSRILLSLSKTEKQKVSMLNVLSFFFINQNASFTFSFSDGFDAQRFELFLYSNTFHVSLTILTSVSMLNVLSFFFISNNDFIRLWFQFRCSTFWAFSLLTFLSCFCFVDMLVSMLNVLSFFFISIL